MHIPHCSHYFSSIKYILCVLKPFYPFNIRSNVINFDDFQISKCQDIVLAIFVVSTTDYVNKANFIHTVAQKKKKLKTVD